MILSCGNWWCQDIIYHHSQCHYELPRAAIAIKKELPAYKNVLRGVVNLREQVTSKATRNRNAASKKLISRKSSKIKGFRFHGGIAQLGERLNGIQEVSGSIPLISTNNRP